VSAASVVVIINRPRPQNSTAMWDPEPEQISVLAGDPNESSASILRRAADQLDAGPQLPGGEA
jgi:hypothetical protein